MKVFICHLSEDKERFVEEFAKKLLDTGIDPFYDDWCLNFGDSLINLFDKIDESDVFIIVLSKNSINSNWVKEELDAGVIRKIEKGTKLIPVIIDNLNDITIPNSLRHIKYCKIDDLNNYDEKFKELRNSIFGIYNKPPRGKKPNFINMEPIDGLNQLDSLIIKQLGGLLYSKHNQFSFDEVMEVTDNEFSKEEILESLEVLENSNLINCPYKVFSGYPPFINLAPNGVNLYCSYYEPNYEIYKKDILSSVLNDDLRKSNIISDKTEVPHFIVLNFIKLLNNKGYLNGDEVMEGYFIITNITGTGKRQLKKMLEN